MKNREKYREEIIKAINECDSCDFMIKTVNPVYSDGWECNDRSEEHTSELQSRI